MRVNAPQTAKTLGGNAGATEIRHLDGFGVSDHHIFDLPFAIDQNADLPAGFKRYFRKLTREFRRDDLFGRDAARGETFDASQLIVF